jgi:hypothetical protein
MALAKTELRLFNTARRRKWLFFPMTYSKSITGYGEFWNYGTPFIVLDRTKTMLLGASSAIQAGQCNCPTIANCPVRTATIRAPMLATIGIMPSA